MDWCYICHKYYEGTSSGTCPYCGHMLVINTTDATTNQRQVIYTQ